MNMTKLIINNLQSNLLSKRRLNNEIIYLLESFLFSDIEKGNFFNNFIGGFN